MNEYNAKIVKVVDGDTYVSEISLGFSLTLNAKIRLAKVNCPELPTPEGEKAKAWAIANLEGKSVKIQTKSYDKYGRVLAAVQLDGKDVGETLLSEGLAEKYLGLEED